MSGDQVRNWHLELQNLISMGSKNWGGSIFNDKFCFIQYTCFHQYVVCQCYLYPCTVIIKIVSTVKTLNTAMGIYITTFDLQDVSNNPSDY